MYHNDCVVYDSYFNCLVFVQSCMLMQRGRGTVELRDISVFHEHYEESMCFVQFFVVFFPSLVRAGLITFNIKLLSIESLLMLVLEHYIFLSPETLPNKL